MWLSGSKEGATFPDPCEVRRTPCKWRVGDQETAGPIGQTLSILGVSEEIVRNTKKKKKKKGREKEGEKKEHASKPMCLDWNWSYWSKHASLLRLKCKYA